MYALWRQKRYKKKSSYETRSAYETCVSDQNYFANIYTWKWIMSTVLFYNRGTLERVQARNSKESGVHVKNEEAP